MAAVPLENLIAAALAAAPNNTLSDHDIAKRLHPDFEKAHASRGARIANIRKACHKSTRITQIDDRTFSLLRTR